MPAAGVDGTLAHVDALAHRPVADTAIAVLVCAVSLGLLSAGAPGGEVTAAGVGLTVLATLPLAARRRVPVAALALTAIAGTALRLVADPVGPPLGVAVALYTVAILRPRLAHPAAAGAFALYLAAAFADADTSRSRELALGVLVWGGAWLLGERARWAERDAERERRLAAAEERTRIARDLHDSAGHAISVILVHAGAGRLAAERDPEAARAAFATIEEVARETVGEFERLVRTLRGGHGASVEPPPGVAALNGLVARHRAAGLDVSATVRGTRRPLPPAVDQGAYRILQEALTNATRHGRGRAEVTIAFAEGAVELTVANPATRAAGADGHGLVGMHERVRLLGGSLHAGASADRFEVRAWLPTTR
jgi:signal transduction histidine kinase